jgi:two-component system chemotaxis response regulator CheY
MAKTMKDGLEKAGLEVVGIGEDGNQGVDLFRIHRPDLVLLDITMPNKDGRECLEEIIAEYPSARVIMVTAIKDDDVMKACLNAGALGFVQKPVNFNDLKQRAAFFRILEQAMDRR